MAERLQVVTVGLAGPSGAGIGDHEDAGNNISHVRVVTSGTRPTGVTEGELIYETDTGLYKSYNGSTWVDPHTAFKAASARAWLAANENVADNVEEQVLYSTESWDPLGMHAGGDFVVPVGYDDTLWLVVAQTTWAAFDTSGLPHGDYRQTSVYLDTGGGDTLDSREISAPTDNTQFRQRVTTIISADAGNTIRVKVNQETGGALAMTGGGANVTFCVVTCLGRIT